MAQQSWRKDKKADKKVAPTPVAPKDDGKWEEMGFASKAAYDRYLEKFPA